MLLQAVIPHFGHAGGSVLQESVVTIVYPAVGCIHIVVPNMVERMFSREYQIQ